MSAPAEPRTLPRRPSRPQQVARVVLGLGLAASLLVWGLPYFAKTSWSEVFTVLGSVPMATAAGLLLLVVVGLWSYTFTLTGSLHGLRHYQALIVNVAGSSVGNLLPGGGAAGLAATYTICRSWGFSRRDISTSAIVTGVWNVMARIALPVIAIAGLFSGAEDIPKALQDAALAATISGLAIIAVFVSALASERAALVVGQGIDKMIRPLTRRSGRGREMSVRALVIDLRARINDIVRTGWLKLTLGLVGYFAVYFVLFVLCLRITDVDMFYGQAFAAYAIGRLLTAVGVTPGGLGVTELATAAALVAWGAHPANATAAVVLFSVYTHLMEIPLGALGWLAWLATPKTEPPEDHREAADGTATSPAAPSSADPSSADPPSTDPSRAATSPDGGPGASGPGRPPRHPG